VLDSLLLGVSFVYASDRLARGGRPNIALDAVLPAFFFTAVIDVTRGVIQAMSIIRVYARF